MENPVKVVTSQISIPIIIKFAIGFIIMNALLELLPDTLKSFFYLPVTTLKSKFGGGGGS